MITRKPADNEPFSALVFKIMTDPFVGQLTFIRVYSGQLKSGDSVLNAGQGHATSASAVCCKMHANKREEISEILAGDICAAVGLKNVSTGDTICDEKHPIVLESIDFPAPVISVAVEPKTKADQEKMGMALAKLAQEDPTFKVHTDPDTGQTIISGMGELHLEIIVDRMMREFRVEANVGKPQVAYRETIRKHVGGRRQVHPPDRRPRSVRPRQDSPRAATSRARATSSSTTSTAASIPKEYIKPIEQGIQGSAGRRHSGRLSHGRREGHAVRRQLSRRRFERNGVQDCRFDGVQGSRPQGQPVLLEPVMAVEVVTPEDYMGTIIGDLSSRRGRIEGMEHRAGSQVIKAMVPLAEMFGYATAHAFAHAGPRRVLDALCALRRSAAQRSGGNHRQGRRAEAIDSKSRGRVVCDHTSKAYGAEEMAKEKFDRSKPHVQHRDDRAHRSRQDDVDGGDHQGVGEAQPEDPVPVVSIRSTTRRKRRRAASRSRRRTWSTRRRTGTTRTWIARATPTTSRT